MELARFSLAFRSTYGTAVLILCLIAGSIVFLPGGPTVVRGRPSPPGSSSPARDSNVNHSDRLQAVTAALRRGGQLPRVVKTRLVQSYGKLPLSFEANQGQTEAQVKFLSRGRGYTLFLTSNEAVLALRKPSAISGQPSPNRKSKLETRKS